MKNNVSADDLAGLLAVVREGGFRAAAQRLGIAASKVSTTVSQIETQLGTPVLRRTRRSQHLTGAGQRLVNRVGPLLSAMDAAMRGASRECGAKKRAYPQCRRSQHWPAELRVPNLLWAHRHEASSGKVKCSLSRKRVISDQKKSA